MFEFLDTTGRTLALRIQSNRNVQVQLSATFVNDRNSIEKAYCETVCETDISVCGGRNVARQSFVSFFFLHILMRLLHIFVRLLQFFLHILFTLWI